MNEPAVEIGLHAITDRISLGVLFFFSRFFFFRRPWFFFVFFWFCSFSPPPFLLIENDVCRATNVSGRPPGPARVEVRKM